MDSTIQSIKRNLHDSHVSIGILISFILSFAEIMSVFLQFGSISIDYISLQITNFLLIIGSWKLIIIILRNDILSKRYRIIYFTLNILVIIGIYIILFYPILEKNFVIDYINMLEGLFSGYAILFGLLFNSFREIDVRKRTGKTLWGVRKSDPTLMSYEKFVAIFLLVIIPILFILASIAGYFIYTFLTEYNLGFETIRIFLTGSPVLVLGLFIFIYASSFNKKYKQRFDKVANQLEAEKLRQYYNSKRGE